MTDSPFAHSVPRDESGRYALVFDRPRAWEFALYGSVLLDQLATYEGAWRDHEIGYVADIGPEVALSDLPDFLSDRQTYVVKLVDNFNRLLSKDIQTRAFGEPGQPGDPALIEHSARRLVDVYAEMIRWAASLRAVRVDDKAERAVELLAQFAEQPVRSVRDFVSEYVVQVDGILVRFRSGETVSNVEIEMSIVLSIPKPILDGYSREMDALAKLLR